MHSGPVSPQPAPGLTFSSQLPVSVLHYIQYILFFPSDVPSDKTRLSQISFQLSSVCLSPCKCSRPEAMPGNAWWLSKGILLMESPESLLPCIHGLRRVWTEGIWTWLYRKSETFQTIFQNRQNLISKVFHWSTSTSTSRSFQLNLNAKHIT